MLSDGKEIPVMYDLVETSRPGRIKGEGQVFGDIEALIAAYHAGPCRLRLEGGKAVGAYLLDCRSTAGVADIRITGKIKWA